MAKDQKPNANKTQTADDILSSLMEDLKDVDKAVSDDSFGNDLGLDPELLKNISATENDDENMEVSINVLFDVLLKTNILMSPHVPFLTEHMYQNMKKCVK